MPPEEKKIDESAASGSAEEIKNLKAEFQRKNDNLAAQLKASNEQMLASIQTMLKPKAAPKEPTEDLETTYYKDPIGAMKKVKEEAKAELRTEFAAANQDLQKKQLTIQQLYKEFPELGNEESELFQSATKKYTDMSKEHGESAATYKLAVAEAALDLGVKPKSKRPKSENDDYNVSGSGNGNRQRSGKQSEELDPMVIETAKLMGVDPEKIKARMKTGKVVISPKGLKGVS